MASVAFDQFLPEVLLEAAGAPVPVAINAIRNACFDFCRDSLWLTQVLGEAAYTSGTQDYTLSAPVDSKVVGALNIVVDGQTTVYPWSMEEVVATRPSWQTDVGLIAGFIQQVPGSVSLISIPSKDGVFKATVALAPTRAATTIDERIYEYHLESIKYGALWKLKSMLSQPWSDPAGASLYEQRFLMMVNQAAVERQRSNSYAAMRVAPRPFV